MGMYKYIKETMQNEYKERSDGYRARLAAWRKEGAVVRSERPTNLPRARTLGYKAKNGYVIVRVRTGRGQRKRPHPMGGRKPAKNVAYLSPGKSYQAMAEEKAARQFPNLDVLNSYWMGEDGTSKYFEIVMVDPVLIDVGTRRKGAFRGLTSAGKKHRGL
jgi:large subunit ribosomal protein L15e